mmetsp:Transcript_16653/g.28381  ORF Transcript_16653/g.28381 Transcript_16653/m.28381 type:complete len:479 (-) Transcript_16653:229-1665(-)
MTQALGRFLFVTHMFQTVLVAAFVPNHRVKTQQQCQSTRYDVNSRTGCKLRDITMTADELQPVEQNPGYTSLEDDPLYSPPAFLRSLSVTAQQARILLLLVSAVYGTNFGCVKLLEDCLPPSIIMAVRFSIATAVLFPLAIATRPNKSLFKPLLAGAETGVWCLFAYTAQAVSLQTSSAGTSAFICALCVLFVPFLDLLKGEPPPRRAVIAAVGASFGVALLEIGPGTPPLTSNDFLSLLQPIFFGLGFWRMETFGRQYPKDALSLTAGQVSVVALFALVWAAHDAIALGGSSGAGDLVVPITTVLETAPSPHGVAFAAGLGAGLGAEKLALTAAVASMTAGLRELWGSVEASEMGPAVVVGTMLWTGLASTTVTGLGETIALTKLTASEATVIFSTEPLWGAVFAYTALGETLGPAGLAGGAVIVGSCLWNAIAQAAGDDGEKGWNELAQAVEGEGEESMGMGSNTIDVGKGSDKKR